MNVLLALSLAVYITTAAATHGDQSSVPRSFPSYVKQRLGKIGHQIERIKQDVKQCCEQKDCSYDDRIYSHGAIFTSTDGCNFCRCTDGEVDCTNSSNCGQQGESSGYNYKDQVAQAYCTSVILGANVSAVRRHCDPAQGEALSCNALCHKESQFANSLRAQFGDFDEIACGASIWFMMDHPVLAANPGPGQTDAGKMNLVTISFNDANCDVTDCSVNYCCCVACTECSK